MKLTAHEYAKAMVVFKDRKYEIEKDAGRGKRVFPCKWPGYNWVLRFDIPALLRGDFENANITLTREVKPGQMSLFCLVIVALLYWFFFRSL